MASGGGGGGQIVIISQLTYVFSSPSTLTTTDNTLIPWLPGRNNIVSKATGQVKAASAGADIVILINLINRTTGALVTNLAMLTILAGSLTGNVSFTPRVILDTQALETQVVQVGSPATEGSDLTVEVF